MSFRARLVKARFFQGNRETVTGNVDLKTSSLAFLKLNWDPSLGFLAFRALSRPAKHFLIVGLQHS